MLRLLRLSAIEQSNFSALVFKDERLISFAFDTDCSADFQRRPLTKYRFERKSGVLVSFELRGGVLLGLEILGLEYGNWDVVLDRFSEEFPRAHEVPLLGMELDGSNTRAVLDLSAITQSQEFLLRWASSTHTLEVTFGEIYSASHFGCGLLLYDQEHRVSGLRIEAR